MTIWKASLEKTSALKKELFDISIPDVFNILNIRKIVPCYVSKEMI